MDQAEYADALARAQRATRIDELHAIATDVQTRHPNDEDAAKVADVCQLYAFDLLERLGRERARARATYTPPHDHTESAFR